MTESRVHILISLYGDKCINCGSGDNIVWHHIVPLSCGGQDIDTNIRPLCRVCDYAVTHHIPVSEAKKVFAE